MKKEAKTTSSSDGQYMWKNQNNSQSNSLIEREDIKGTPFWLVKMEDNYFISWGDYKLTENRKSKEECLSLLEEEQWNITGAWMVSMMDRSMKLGLFDENSEIYKRIEEKVRESTDIEYWEGRQGINQFVK